MDNFANLIHYMPKSILIGFGSTLFILNILFFLFVLIYVYNDCNYSGMNRLLWVSISIFVPNYLGFMTYLIVRAVQNSSSKHDTTSINSTSMPFKFTKKHKLLLLIFLAILLAVSSGPYIYHIAKKEYLEYKQGKITKTETDFESHYGYFSGEEEKELRYPKDGILTISYSSKVKSGNLVIGIYNYDGTPIQVFDTDTNSDVTVPIEKNQIYKLIARGDNTSGYYKFSWKLKKK